MITLRVDSRRGSKYFPCESNDLRSAPSTCTHGPFYFSTTRRCRDKSAFERHHNHYVPNQRLRSLPAKANELYVSLFAARAPANQSVIELVYVYGSN